MEQDLLAKGFNNWGTTMSEIQELHIVKNNEASKLFRLKIFGKKLI